MHCKESGHEYQGVSNKNNTQPEGKEDIEPSTKQEKTKNFAYNRQYNLQTYYKNSRD